jgi:ABC-2 type transport system permease protein
MNSIWYIYKRELGRYFHSPIAYIVVVLFLLITGGMFWANFFEGFPELSMRRFFGDAPLFLGFFAPAIAMGLLAEEKRSGTLELLMTMPVSDLQIVVGKFAAAMTLLAVTLAFTTPYAFSISTMGDLDWGPVVGGYAGLFLLGGAYVAIGMMASSWTREQIVAILVGFFLCFVLFILDRLFTNSTGAVAQTAEYLSSNFHFQNIARGVIRLSDVLYYLSVMGICLAVTRNALVSRRW